MPSPDFNPTQSQNSNLSSSLAVSSSSYGSALGGGGGLGGKGVLGGGIPELLLPQAGGLYGSSSVGLYDSSYGGMMPMPINAPQITSEVEDKALVGQVYSYQVSANKLDGNNEGIIYSLEIAPNNMSIDSQSGLITWSPKRDDVGPKVIKLKVAGDDGMIATQSYQLNVIDDTTPPEDVTAFTVKAGDKSVVISWNQSADRVGDLAFYFLYIDSDNGYDEPIYLERDNISYQADGLNNNIAYTFKLTAIDHSNNESAGAVAFATPSLPQQPLIQQTYTTPFFRTQAAYTDFFNLGDATGGDFPAPYWTSWEWTKDPSPHSTWQLWNSWPINNDFYIPSWEKPDFQFKDIFQNFDNSWQRKTNNPFLEKTTNYYLR